MDIKNRLPALSPAPRRGSVPARLCCLLACVLLLLSGCAGRDAAPPSSPTASPAVTARGLGSAGEGSILSGKLLGHLSALEEMFSLLDRYCLTAFGWTIPRDVLSSCAEDIATHHISGEGDERVCTAVHSVRTSYTATGMDEGLPGQTLATRTPQEMREDDMGTGSMDTGLMGDFTAAGGGDYVRTVKMRLSPDASFGTVEITLTLNGEESGRETFVFLALSNVLYYLDAASNITAYDPDGNAQGDPGWLITCGRLSKETADVVEYPSSSFAPPDPGDLPASDLNALAALSGALRLTVQNGTGRVAQDGKVLEEFTAR